MATLYMSLPKNYVEAVSRRFNGQKLPEEKRAYYVERMDMLYTQYKKAKKREQKLHEFWDTANVEGHFRRPIWYNAHARLKAVEKDIKANASSMFYLLLEADGNNNGERYDPFWCISPDEIYADFCKKYKNI